jgi:hypothetical protein
LAVTVNEKESPAVVEAGTFVRRSWLAFPGVTDIGSLETVRAPDWAETVWLPTVLSVVEKVPLPLVRSDELGTTPEPSEVPKATKPEKPVAVLL